MYILVVRTIRLRNSFIIILSEATLIYFLVNLLIDNDYRILM